MIDDYYDCLNKRIAGRTRCDYRHDDKIVLNEYSKSYYQNNKDKWKMVYNRKNV